MDLNEIINSTPGLVLRLLDYAGWNYKKTGSHYVGACPVCKNGNKTPNTVFNERENSFYCFACNSSGGLKVIAENLNVDFTEFLKREGIIQDDKKSKQYQGLEKGGNAKLGVDTNKQLKVDIYEIASEILEKDVKDYLLSRYINPDIVKPYIYNLRQRQNGAYKYLEQFYKESYKLVIPAFDKEGNLRAIKIRNINKQEPKVKHLTGLKQYSIGIDKITKDAVAVIIVEGEIDYLTLITLYGEGNNIVALPSANYTFTEDEKQALPEDVILLLDNDDAGKKATERIAADLKKAGKRVFIAEYPENIKDLNDLLVFYKGDTNKALEELESIIGKAITNEYTLTKSFKQIAKNYLERIKRKIKENEWGINLEPKVYATGLTFLDELLDGGLRRGLYGIAGQPGIGKTSFILSLANLLAKNNKKSLIISLEMTDEDLLIQILSWLTGIPKIKLLDENINQLELEELEEAVNNPIFRNILVDTGNNTIDAIETRIVDALNDTGGELVVFIDYLQQIKPSKELIKSDYRLQTKDIAYRLKEIANKYEIPVFVISSTQRDGYNDRAIKKPNYIAMFKESGDIEYSLYAGYFLDYPTEKEIDNYQKKKHEQVIKIVKVKSRFGSVKDKDNNFISKVLILDFKTGELRELLKDEGDVVDF